MLKMAETCFLDGPLSDRKVLRQRTIGTPFGDQLQDLAFAWSQSVQNGGLVPAADQLTHHLRVECGAPDARRRTAPSNSAMPVTRSLSR